MTDTWKEKERKRNLVLANLVHGVPPPKDATDDERETYERATRYLVEKSRRFPRRADVVRKTAKQIAARQRVEAVKARQAQRRG